MTGAGLLDPMAREAARISSLVAEMEREGVDPDRAEAMRPWADVLAGAVDRLQKEWRASGRGNAPRPCGGHAGTGSTSDDSGGAGARPSRVHLPLWS